MIGEPTEGILTRSMDAKLIADSASKCLFADFLFEMKPKKVFEALKHPEWVDAMQEELNQFYRNRENSMSPLRVSEKTGKKKKSRIVTQSTPKSQGLETSKAPLRKGKSPRPKDLLCSYHYQMDQRENSDDDLKDESDEEMFEAGEEMDKEFLQSANEETQSPYSTETPIEEPISTKHQSHSPNKDDPKSSRAKKSANSLDASDSELSSFSKTFKPYDNYMPVIERKLNSDGSLRNYKNIVNKFNLDHVTRLNKILTNLKEVQTAVKEDPTLNKKVLEAAKAYTKNLTNLTELHTLPFSTSSSSVPKLTFALTGVLPKSNDTVIDITPPKEHHESPHTTPKPNSGKGIARDSDESPRKLVPASKEAHMEKEERLEKATREARLMLLSKPKLIKLVTEAGVDPKSL
nr:hypothetical protein [Tanacetum cinerariifolium]